MEFYLSREYFEDFFAAMKALDVPNDSGAVKELPPKIDTEANAMSLVTAASLGGLFGGGIKDADGDIFMDALDADEIAKNAVRVCAVDFTIHHMKGVLELSTHNATKVEVRCSAFFCVDLSSGFRQWSRRSTSLSP